MISRELQPLAKNVLTILINISSDAEVLKCLAEDDTFLESVLLRVTVRGSHYHLSLSVSVIFYPRFL